MLHSLHYSWSRLACWRKKFKSLADKKVKTFAFSTNYTTSSLFKQNFKNCVLNSRLIKKRFFFRKCKQCQQQLWILISRANLLRDKKFPLVSDSGFPANGITVVLSHKSIRWSTFLFHLCLLFLGCHHIPLLLYFVGYLDPCLQDDFRNESG